MIYLDKFEPNTVRSLHTYLVKEDEVGGIRKIILNGYGSDPSQAELCAHLLNKDVHRKFFVLGSEFHSAMLIFLNNTILDKERGDTLYFSSEELVLVAHRVLRESNVIRDFFFFRMLEFTMYDTNHTYVLDRPKRNSLLSEIMVRTVLKKKKYRLYRDTHIMFRRVIS